MNKKNLPSSFGVIAILFLSAMASQMWGIEIPQGYYFTRMNGVFGPAALPVLYITAIALLMGSMYGLGRAASAYDNWRDR